MTMILGVLESAKVSPERIFELGNFGRRKNLVRADENVVFLALRLENFDFFQKRSHGNTHAEESCCKILKVF